MALLRSSGKKDRLPLHILSTSQTDDVLITLFGTKNTFVANDNRIEFNFGVHNVEETHGIVNSLPLVFRFFVHEFASDQM